MSGLFIHASWRSAGTWLWEELRSQPKNMGFYEPLHETLPRIGVAEIDRLNTNSWRSRHPALTKPYFWEYQALLKSQQPNRRRAGVENAKAAFSFDRYFMGSDERHDELFRYITVLCETAFAQNRQPVLKFTRSQGRLPWFVRCFPQFKHPLLVRQPWGKFQSAWRCLQEDDNPYFFAAPIVVLERNAENSDVAALIRALELPIGGFRPGTSLWRLRYWKRAVLKLGHDTLYKTVLALWLLNIAYALPAADEVLDGDHAPEAFAAAFGIDLSARERRPVRSDIIQPRLRIDQVKSAHETAMAVLAPRVDRVVMARISGWVAVSEAAAQNDLLEIIDSPPASPRAGRFRRRMSAIRSSLADAS